MTEQGKDLAADEIPYDIIRERLDNLCTAVGNKLQRQWPVRWGQMEEAPVVLQGHVLVATNTFKTIRYFCADKPPDSSRKLEYGLSVTPLARTILDSVFTVIFLFEDLEKQIAWYLKAGWKELHLEQKKLEARYGSDPKWIDWIQRRQRFVDDLELRARVLPDEKQNLKLIDKWPNPGQMPSYRNIASKKASEDLNYLNEWFYRNLSQNSHLSLSGLLERAPILMRYLHQKEDFEAREKQLQDYKAGAVSTTILLLLCLMSEIKAGVGYSELEETCRYVWTIMSSASGAAKELYDRRYDALLS